MHSVGQNNIEWKLSGKGLGEVFHQLLQRVTHV